MTIESIRKFIQEEILNDPSFGIEPEQDLLLTETLDSLGVTRLVHHLEGELGIEIPPQDVTLENFRSLQQIADYLASRTT